MCLHDTVAVYKNYVSSSYNGRCMVRAFVDKRFYFILVIVLFYTKTVLFRVYSLDSIPQSFT